MKIAIYPGSFNPWHEGHQDVLDQALKIFDKVIIAIGKNSEKPEGIWCEKTQYILNSIARQRGDARDTYVPVEGLWDIECVEFDGMLVDYVKTTKPSAIIKGLRNAQDLEYETTQQYWNEDLGVQIPTFYVICDRAFRHISSSAIRAVEKAKKGN